MIGSFLPRNLVLLVNKHLFFQFDDLTFLSAQTCDMGYRVNQQTEGTFLGVMLHNEFGSCEGSHEKLPTCLPKLHPSSNFFLEINI